MGFWAGASVLFFILRHDRAPSIKEFYSSNVDLLVSYSCPATLSRLDAAHLLDTQLLPTASFGARLRISGASASENDGSKAIAKNDPSLELGYGEFPFQSLDLLVDAAIKHRVRTTKGNHAATKQLTFLDLGSGAGRVCLYMAMTRPGWNIHGIEVVPSLHEIALLASRAAVEQEILSTEDHDALALDKGSSSALHFSLGAAQSFIQVLQQADIVFCYSTAFDSAGFSTQTGSMILSRQWMELLGHCCTGTIVITTDRACDPAYGWTLSEALEVANREVMGSIGYVQRLD